MLKMKTIEKDYRLGKEKIKEIGKKEAIRM